ncbi:DUF1062 domain-containing protein [Kineosporia sp. NBRC 101677]|uniref:DUF1062 domain-containing protein n=1 Tax=Kineosporia sp. NBRC 101677 TaxID=3032197 RepID=UPI003332DC14
MVPTDLPTIVRRCHVCGASRFRASGKFRVNAHHKVLDAWLLLLCTRCGDTVKLTVLERVGVRAVRPQMLAALHGNSPALVSDLLQDPRVLGRNGVALDWRGCWRLDTSGSVGLEQLEVPGVDALEVSVRFGGPVPVRPVSLIAEGCGLSRGEVKRLVVDGKLVSGIRLGGLVRADFAFTVKP